MRARQGFLKEMASELRPEGKRRGQEVGGPERARHRNSPCKGPEVTEHGVCPIINALWLSLLELVFRVRNGGGRV